MSCWNVYTIRLLSATQVQGDIPLGTRLVGLRSGDRVGRGSANLLLGLLLLLFVRPLPHVSIDRQEDRGLTSVVD
jgi:hypothetical protein